MKVVRRQQQEEEQGFSSADWRRLAAVIVLLAVVSLGIGWLATRAGTSNRKAPPAPAQVAVPHPPPAAVAQPAPVWPVRVSRVEEPEQHVLSHYEMVRETVQGLRDHARQDPHAPDVLTEAQIKAIEARGAVLN